MTTEPKINTTNNALGHNLLVNNRWLILAAAIVVLVYLLSPILSPFIAAAILAYICDPLVGKLAQVGTAKYKLGRTTATLLVMLLVFSAIAALFFIIVPLIQKELFMVAERIPSYVATLKSRLEPYFASRFGITFEVDATQVKSVLKENWTTASGILAQFLKLASTHSLAIVGVVLNLLLIPIVLFYLLRDWDILVARIGSLVPRRWFDKTQEITLEIDQVLAEFLRGQLSVMILMSIFYVTGLWLCGLEAALPIGLVAGLLGFVPYLGIAIGILLAVLAAALQFTSFNEMIPIAIVFTLGQVLESMWVTPKLVGDRIGLHPVIVIFALLAGSQLFGFTGVLLALPVSAALAVGLRHALNSYLNSSNYLK